MDAERRRGFWTVRVSLAIPREEMRRLVLAVTEASETAGGGRLADAYTILLDGVERARVLRDWGEPWAPALVSCWIEAVEGYCLQYGLREGGGVGVGGGRLAR